MGLLHLLIFTFVAIICSGQKLFKPFNALDVGNARKFSKAGEKGSILLINPNPLSELQRHCYNRSDIEYIRDPANVKFRCDVVYRCERPGNGKSDAVVDYQQDDIRIVRVQCPQGLHFDIERQTCDWRHRVKNCDLLSRVQLVKPNFHTTSPACIAGQLQCGDGACLPISDFCNGERDCRDGSDENACTLEEDPNAAPLCDVEKCKLPECFCAARHDDEFVVNPFEGKLSIDQIPQMILLSFNGAVNGDNFKVYEDIFNDKFAINPNNCSAKGTFFVSHKYTNYSAVQELRRRGHEISTFSVSLNNDPSYWSDASWDDWFDEISGGRAIIEKYADIQDSSILGMRAPFLQTGGNRQFSMLHDSIFTYDASITVPLSKIPMWPYTLHHRIPHKCSGNGGKCPTRAYPMWEVPINELDRRDNAQTDETLTGCALVSSCGNLNNPKQFRRFLDNNFNRHYTTSRAPLSLPLDASWLVVNKGFVKVLTEWMDSLLKKHPDVFFVSHTQAIHWIQSSVEVERLQDFEPWKSPVCRSSGLPACFLPNICPLKTDALRGEINRLHTCVDCPKHYPWLRDTAGEGISV